MKKPTENPHAALARDEELVVQELSDEVLIYDLRQHKAHCLNQTAAFVWNHCDGETSADEIATLMAKEWRTPVSADAVWFALDKLSKADLLQNRITLPEEKAGLSRRNAVRRLGLGALMAAPLVMSLVSPHAASAATIPPPCAACRKKSDGACPTVCSGTIFGTCYDNAGCGAGQARSCVTCQDCFAGLGGTLPPHLTISWKAPGDSC
jgi:hypothetical protein